MTNGKDLQKLLVKMVQLYFYGMEDSSSKPTVTISKPKTYMTKQVVLQTQQIIKNQQSKARKMNL